MAHVEQLIRQITEIRDQADQVLDDESTDRHLALEDLVQRLTTVINAAR